MTHHSLSGRTVVITGASSGIGRAAAEAFAAEGAKLVLAARGRQALDDTAEACRRVGAEVLVHPTDVTDASAVRALAAEARRFGQGIDVWFSNVGIGAVGKFHDTPIAAHEQVIRANLIGHINDAHAVLPIFIEQRRGVFINMISVGGYVATPFASSYGASKFGLRGFSEALRAELSEYPDIHVCDVYPSFVDTPGLAHGANYTGRYIGLPPGSHDPRRVADVVVQLARHPRATAAVGPEVTLARFAHGLAPNLLARLMSFAFGSALARARGEHVTNGTLYEPPAKSDGVSPHRRQPGERATIGTAAKIVGMVLAMMSYSLVRRIGQRTH